MKSKRVKKKCTLTSFQHTSLTTLHQGTTDWCKINTNKPQFFFTMISSLLPQMVLTCHMRTSTKPSQRQEKRPTYSLSPRATAGSYSVETDLSHQFRNITNSSMLFAPLQISLLPLLMQCTMHYAASTNMSWTRSS
jgi:hypothetical protein